MTKGEISYQSYLKGDDSAFDTVVEVYYDNLLFFINSYVHNLADAEDLAIDTLLQLVIHKKRYNFKTSLKTYLFTIGRNKALNFLKHSKVHREEKLEDSKNSIENKDYNSLEENIITDEKKRNVHRALSNLPKDMATALYLVYFEGLSYEDTASVMKKRKKQVDNLIYRGKNEMKKFIDREGELLL
ncbi:MAG: RNA polymerase sigma factor [Oscillospiraceae bacterium]|nr:RNA polymerase sigma factor [Oscillospiraceae bacterium]